jgi:hypothetical protein
MAAVEMYGSVGDEEFEITSLNGSRKRKRDVTKRAEMKTQRNTT